MSKWTLSETCNAMTDKMANCVRNEAPMQLNDIPTHLPWTIRRQEDGSTVTGNIRSTLARECAHWRSISKLNRSSLYSSSSSGYIAGANTLIHQQRHITSKRGASNLAATKVIHGLGRCGVTLHRAKLVDSELCPACGVTDSVSHICTTCQRDGLQERRNIWADRVRDVVSEYINCNDLRDDLQTLITSSADYLPGGNPSTTWKSTGRTASLLSQVAKAALP